MENNNKKQPIRQLIDRETGELIDIFEGDRVQIISRKQNSAIKHSIKGKELNEEIKYWNEELGGFIFVLFKYCDLILNEHPEIKPEDITKLFYLATYVDYNGNLIYNNRYMTKECMMELLHIKQRQFDTFFKKMKDSEIFLYKNKTIKINTNYFIKGEITKEIQLHSGYTRLYINAIRFLYDNVKITKHHQLGMYFKLIPYIHRQKNVLCHNPDSYESDIKLMNVKELKEKIGYHRNGIRKFINELLSTKLKNGESILVSVRNDPDEGKSYIIFNPRIFYGGNFNIQEGKTAIMKCFKTIN